MTRASTDSKVRPKARARSLPKLRDAERTRKRLLDAAEVVFSKHGLDGASTEAIARRAGVSKTMLFYYFQNKEQLYLEVLKRLFELVVDPSRAAEIENMSPREALRAIVHGYFDIHLNRPAFAELTLREAMTYGGKHLHRLRYDLPFVGQLIRVLRRGVLSGEFRGVDPLKTTVSMVGMIKILFAYRAAMERVLEQEVLTGEAVQEWREHVVDLLLYGVSASGPDLSKPLPPEGRSISPSIFEDGTEEDHAGLA
jgi:TetR/AcrR family transcriptional regulator